MTNLPGHSDAPDQPEPVGTPEPATVPLSAAPPPPPTPPASPTAPPARRPPWYRRLPGHLGLWVAALALVGACVIGCGGFVAGVVVSHGFGDGRGVGRVGHRDPRQPGGRLRNGPYGPGWQRGPRQGRTAPAPQPLTSLPPAQPSAPSPAASPTA